MGLCVYHPVLPGTNRALGTFDLMGREKYSGFSHFSGVAKSCSSSIKPVLRPGAMYGGEGVAVAEDM